MSDAVSRATLVALRDRREQVIQHLSDSFVADLITIEELDDRLARAPAATVVADVDALVTDLAPLPTGAPSTALAPLAVNPALAVATKRIRSIFGNVERGGSWVVPARMEVSATFGNVELDFRDARFSSGVIELNARVVFGNLEIIVRHRSRTQTTARGEGRRSNRCSCRWALRGRAGSTDQNHCGRGTTGTCRWPAAARR
jgi:hypothetical protein